MKEKRQRAILEILRRQQISTQEELAEALGRLGFNVTQATVSRDIRDLNLGKRATPDGGSCYVAVRPGGSMDERYTRMLSDSLLSAADSGVMVVIRTLPGSAGVAGEALDCLEWPEVLGTIAGDNTIFLVADKPEHAAAIT